MDNAQDESKIILKFTAPGSVFFDMQIEGNVYPGQMLVVGNRLIEMAENFYRQAEAMQKRMQEQNRIVVPKPKIELSK